jgi:hypothetical protein
LQGVALSAYEDYYGEDPFIEQFEFRYYPDAEPRYRPMKAR